MLTKTIPNAIRRAREQAGFTREQLAVKAGLASNTLYLAERAGLVSRRTLERLSAVLGLPVEDLKPVPLAQAASTIK